MAEIIIAKHRNGAVGDVRLRFIGQYTRFQNPEDDLIVPPPTAEGGGIMRSSSMNTPIGSTATPPPPAPVCVPQEGNPCGNMLEGALRF